MFNTTEKRERALGVKLFLKGKRCSSAKCAVIRRQQKPGQHGAARVRAMSEYGTQLKEKQKFQFSYGIRESQVRSLFTKALKSSAITGQTFLSLLESRLDNVVFRLGFAESRSIARQMVSHGHITVNGRKLNIPSYSVSLGDVISIRKESRDLKNFLELANYLKKYEAPVWLSLDKEKLEGKVLEKPKDFDISFDVNLVVDYYSKSVK
ncbi:MAG: 30S ribosomal protein S4 [Candidatus Pacebacteria bacterium]|nr:30S ribosomal protein S4 [Candidatus Paceibacterota bacterium]